MCVASLDLPCFFVLTRRCVAVLDVGREPVADVLLESDVGVGLLLFVVGLLVRLLVRCLGDDITALLFTTSYTTLQLSTISPP